MITNERLLRVKAHRLTDCMTGGQLSAIQLPADVHSFSVEQWLSHQPQLRGSRVVTHREHALYTRHDCTGTLDTCDVTQTHRG